MDASQAFDIKRLSNFADDKAARHHKAFWGEVEIGSFSSLGCPHERHHLRRVPVLGDPGGYAY